MKVGLLARFSAMYLTFNYNKQPHEFKVQHYIWLHGYSKGESKEMLQPTNWHTCRSRSAHIKCCQITGHSYKYLTSNTHLYVLVTFFCTKCATCAWRYISSTFDVTSRMFVLTPADWLVPCGGIVDVLPIVVLVVVLAISGVVVSWVITHVQNHNLSIYNIHSRI